MPENTSLVPEQDKPGTTDSAAKAPDPMDAVQSELAEIRKLAETSAKGYDGLRKVLDQNVGRLGEQIQAIAQAAAQGADSGYQSTETEAGNSQANGIDPGTQKDKELGYMLAERALPGLNRKAVETILNDKALAPEHLALETGTNKLDWYSVIMSAGQKVLLQEAVELKVKQAETDQKQEEEKEQQKAQGSISGTSATDVLGELTNGKALEDLDDKELAALMKQFPGLLDERDLPSILKR